MMRRITWGAALLVLLIGCTDDGASPRDGNEESPSGRGREPNILIIVTDDERVGPSLEVMPETRRWVTNEGTTFTNAFATTPLCCPSRASIMTGRYAHNHRVLRNELGSLVAPTTTIQHHLKGAGYQTAITGKYLQGIPLTKDPPDFDRWSIMLWGYYGTKFNIEGQPRFIKRYSTDFLASRAERYMRELEKKDDEPWLLYVAPFAPHTPYTPKRAYESADVPALERTEAFDARGAKELRAGMPHYTASEASRAYEDQLRALMSVDDLVGDLFREMTTLDEARDTLVLYVSDNGFLFGEYGLFAKRVPYDPAARVPLIVRWPDHFPRGAVDDRMVANIDIAPTILDAAGVTDNESRDGKSLLMDGELHDHLVLEGWREGPADPQDPLTASLQWLALRSPEFLYVEYYSRQGGDAIFREYYDLETDPLALENLLADPDPSNDPDVDALSAQLRSEKDCTGEECP